MTWWNSRSNPVLRIITISWLLLILLSILSSLSHINAQGISIPDILQRTQEASLAAEEIANHKRVADPALASQRSILTNKETEHISQNENHGKTTPQESVTLTADVSEETKCHPKHLVRLNVVFDAVIALAYFSIPIEVAYFYHRHPSPQLFWVYVLFFSFIMLCGITHAIHAFSPYEMPTLHAFFKVLCGIVSVITAVYLTKFIPVALNLPQYAALLENEIQERTENETSLRNQNEEMRKLRTCTESIRRILNISSILTETTTSLTKQLELESACFIDYITSSQTLTLVAPFADSPNHPAAKLPYSLRSTSSNAIEVYRNLLKGNHVRILSTSEVEALFGKDGYIESSYDSLSVPAASFGMAMNVSSSDKGSKGSESGWKFSGIPFASRQRRRGANNAGLASSYNGTLCALVKMPDALDPAVLILQRSPGCGWNLGELDLVRDITTQVEIALDQAKSIEKSKDTVHVLQTKNRELEQAQHRAEMATQAKSKFIAIMSHEMRTPLYVITALTELLSHTNLNAEQRDSLDNITNSSKLLMSIISDILDYSKFQQDTFVMDKAPFNLRACIEKSIELVAMRAKDKGLETSYFLSDGLPEVVDTDETRLSQVFINLLSNSIKFTDSGSLHIEGFLERFLSNEEVANLSALRSSSTIPAAAAAAADSHSPVGSSSQQLTSTSNTLTGSSASLSVSSPSVLPNSSTSGLSTSAAIIPSTSVAYVAPVSTSSSRSDSKLALLHFIVKDTGIGIQKEQIPKLFKEFVQLDTSVNRKYDGTGLGLAICKKVVGLMGGNIWIDASHPGHGAHFHFTIVTKVPPHYLTSTLSYPRSGFKGIEILVVTASHLLTLQMTDFARVGGISLTFTRSLKDAVNQIQKSNPFHGIFVDATIVLNSRGQAAQDLYRLRSDHHIAIIADYQSQVETINHMISSVGSNEEEKETTLSSTIRPLKLSSVYDCIKLMAIQSNFHSEQTSPQSTTSLYMKIKSSKTYPKTGEPSAGEMFPSVESHTHGTSSIGNLTPRSLNRTTTPPELIAHLPPGDSAMPDQSSVPLLHGQILHSSSYPTNAVSQFMQPNSSSGHTVKTTGSDLAASPSFGSDSSGGSNTSPLASPRHLDDILHTGENHSDIKVLLVEDNVVCRKVCMQQLAKLGISNVDIAEDGAVAVNKVKKGSYDLVLMDVMMPVIDGLTATKLIRFNIEQYSQPYIMAITASSMLEEGSREACLTAGMDDVVPKPINLKALKDALSRFLLRRRSQ